MLDRCCGLKSCSSRNKERLMQYVAMCVLSCLFTISEYLEVRVSERKHKIQGLPKSPSL